MATNTKHFEIIRHMLGMNSKRRQEWGTRNYFATYTDGTDYETMRTMENLGLVNHGTTSPSGMHYFHVTEKGLAYVGMRRAGNGYLIPLDEEATA